MRYEQIKPLLDEEVLNEVKMSPSALQKFANSPEAENMLMGIEFELCVPNVAVDDDSGDGEYDYDMDERAYSIDDIIEFFRNGEMSNLGSSSAQRLREQMWDQYLDWQNEQINNNIDQEELEDRIRDALREDYDWEDYIDDARETLEADDELPEDETSDEFAQAVNEKAKDLRDEYVESLMGHDREYEDYYETFRQEMEDDMRDDSDYDQESWLKDIGIDYMSEAEREWGLDWPHWRSYGNGGEVDVDTIGDEFGRAMGLDQVNTSRDYHGARRDGVHWIIEPDSSIDAEEGDGGLEFVSPPMPIKDGLEMIKKFYAWAKKEGCYTNSSTGLHMNISVPDMTIEKLDYVKLALFLGDEHVLKQFGRQYNNYCKSAMSKIKDRIKPEEVPQVLAQMKQHLNSLASKTIHSGITDKYTSINTKSNYVEFRGPGGDYLDKDPFEIVNTVLRLSMSLRIATDPEAYKQEYAKKLYKLTEQEKDPDNSVKLFSQYAVGEMPKEDLISRIKFARKERETAKNKVGQVSRMVDDTGVKEQVKSMGYDARHAIGSIKDRTDAEVNRILQSFEAGNFNNEFTNPEQKSLFKAILENEIQYRKEQGDQKAYWVGNKDGSGGRQMVYARNENEAILKGGSQMGMKREESITKLKAEEKRELTTKELFDNLPQVWKDFFNNIADKDRGDLQANINALTNDPNYREALGGESFDFVVNSLRQEMRRREGRAEPLPGDWDNWIDKITSHTDSQLTNTARLIQQGGSGISSLNASDKEYILSRIRQEFERRIEAGRPSTQIGTPEPENADAVFNSLPNSYKSWLEGMSASNDATLQNVIDNLANGIGSATNLNADQRSLVISRIQQELRSRRGGEAEGAWPRPWGQWVANIQGQGLANINNVRASMTDPSYQGSNLNNEQKRELVRLIDVELRRRMEAGETGEAQAVTLPSTWQAFVNNLSDYSDETIATNRTRIVQGFYDSELNLAQASKVLEKIQAEQNRRTADAARGNPAQDELDFSSPDDETIDDVMGGGDDEAAVAQQSDLINRDDPVTSNDPEAQSEDFEIRNPHTNSVVSMVRNGNLDYAIQKARQHEQDLGLEAGTLQVNRVGQTNESINTIRRLAGLM